MTKNQLVINLDNLYSWRSALQETLIPTLEVKKVIDQINDMLEEMGVRHLEKRFFIITNPEGNAAGEHYWIVRYDPTSCSIKDGQIEVYEEFTTRSGTDFVPLEDLTEITARQYEEIGFLASDGDDTAVLIDLVLTGASIELSESENVLGTTGEKPSKATTSDYDTAERELNTFIDHVTRNYHVSHIQWIQILSGLINEFADDLQD